MANTERNYPVKRNGGVIHAFLDRVRKGLLTTEYSDIQKQFTPKPISVPKFLLDYQEKILPKETRRAIGLLRNSEVFDAFTYDRFNKEIDAVTERAYADAERQRTEVQEEINDLYKVLNSLCEDYKNRLVMEQREIEVLDERIRRYEGVRRRRRSADASQE